MSTTYSNPGDDVLSLLARCRDRWHRPLAEAGVRVGVVMAANDDGPAIKHAGYPALATIKIMPLKERLKKGYDAELVIDLRWWESCQGDEDKLLPLLDHELSHLELAKCGRDADDGSLWFSRDDLGRPKLKLRQGDWNCGDGFADVIYRHGQYAVELQNLLSCKARADAARLGLDPAEHAAARG